MDKSEIISRLKKIGDHAIHVKGESPFVMSLDDGIAVNEAIDMLKEQEPKLVIRGRYNFPYCPHCSTEESRTELTNMLYPEMKFCPYCGGDILWE